MHLFIPALASWYGATICEVPISNPAREAGRSHYGISRTFRVMFDLLTIRFLLNYMTRPLHLFGGIGSTGLVSGSGIALWLLLTKLLSHGDVGAQHAPWFAIAAVLMLGGIQMIGIGLLGELQVRHFFAQGHRSPYTIDRLVRMRPSEESMMH